MAVNIENYRNGLKLHHEGRNNPSFFQLKGPPEIWTVCFNQLVDLVSETNGFYVVQCVNICKYILYAHIICRQLSIGHYHYQGSDAVSPTIHYMQQQDRVQYKSI